MTKHPPPEAIPHPHIVKINPSEAVHSRSLVDLLREYALGEMGGQTKLPLNIEEELPFALAKRSDYVGLLAFVGNESVALLNAFEGFSTFNAKPLLNIHDLFVKPRYRGRQIAGQLLGAAAEIATQRGCCKLTLEVLERNYPAKTAYEHAGFKPYELDESKGSAEFWEKKLEKN